MAVKDVTSLQISIQVINIVPVKVFGLNVIIIAQFFNLCHNRKSSDNLVPFQKS